MLIYTRQTIGVSTLNVLSEACQLQRKLTICKAIIGQLITKINITWQACAIAFTRVFFTAHVLYQYLYNPVLLEKFTKFQVLR